MMSEPDNLHAHIAPPPTHTPTKIFAQRYWKHNKRKRTNTKTSAQYTKQQLKERVLNGSILSDAYDTVCISNAGMIGDPFIQTTQQSTKVFSVADGRQNSGSNVAKLHHPVSEPAQTVDMVPDLAGQHSSVEKNLLRQDTSQSATATKLTSMTAELHAL